jgi:hypothetical protein
MDLRNKSAAELHYIIRDAGEAARNMRGLDDKAEAKYLDQVNDAATELARRQRAAAKLPRWSAARQCAALRVKVSQ